MDASGSTMWTAEDAAKLGAPLSNGEIASVLGLTSEVSEVVWEPTQRIRLLQKWVGIVREFDQDTFTADFVTVLVGQDTDRVTHQIDETLSVADRDLLTEGALVEWRVFGWEKNDGTPVRASYFRVTPRPDPA